MRTAPALPSSVQPEPDLPTDDYDRYEEYLASETELHAIVVGAQLDEDDDPPPPTDNTTGLPFAADRWTEFKKDIEYKSDAEIAMAAEEDFELHALAEPAPAAPVPDPQPSSPPDMPPPDPLNTPILAPSFPLTHPPYLIDELYNGDFSESPATTLYSIDSSYYSDGEYPDHNDDYYDDYYDDMPDYYDQLSHLTELPRFNSYLASELAIPFLSSAGTAAEDIEVPHPCIFPEPLHFMEMTPAEAETEYLRDVLTHMCPEFIAECPEAVELMQTLGLQVFVPQNWDGARIDALKLRFSSDFPATLHARLIPVNPRLYAHAKKEFDRLCQYHLVPSNAPYSSNLVIAPKETAPFVRFCGNYIPINKYILSSQHPIPDVKHKIELIQQHSYFADLDMVNSFHQLFFYILLSLIK